MTTTQTRMLQPAGDVTSVGFSQARLDALDDYVSAQAENGGPSLALSVVRHGRIVMQRAYGYAKKYQTPFANGRWQPAVLLPKDQWQRATADTLYDLASNTKMYATNYAVQQLVSEGRLDLDRPLQSLPGWENYTDAATEYTGRWSLGGEGGITAAHTGKDTITVADLLHHRAGEIPDPQYQNLAVAGGLYYQGGDIRDRSVIRDRAGIIDAICRTPLMLQPRTRYLYSDVDFMILGLLVEQISGQSLDRYMHDHFYSPLGLEHTTFTPLRHGFDAHQIAATELNGNTRDGTVGFGTFPDGRPVPIREYTLQGEAHDEKAFYTMGGVAGHAGLFSSVRDMAVLTQLMLNGGVYDGTRYFSSEVASRFTTPYSREPSQTDALAHLGAPAIGLGWVLQSPPATGHPYFGSGPSSRAYGHQGWTGTLTIIDPAYDMTVVILTNMRHSPVLDSPNGFEASRYPISGMRAVSDRIYDALEPREPAVVAGVWRKHP